MKIPALPRDAVPLVAGEGRGVVHQHAKRPRQLTRLCHETLNLGLLAEIRLEHGGFSPCLLDLLDRLSCLLVRAAVVNDHGEASRCQLLREGTSDPARRAGDQCAGSIGRRQVHAHDSGSKSSASELIQKRKPVGSGPSSKTCPWWAPQVAQ